MLYYAVLKSALLRWKVIRRFVCTTRAIYNCKCRVRLWAVA